MGRVGYPLRLSAARLRHRAGRTALVALGVAAGAGALAAVGSASAIVQDRALGGDLRTLDPADGTVRATWGGIPAQGTESFASLDRRARRALEPVTGREPFAVLQFRESELGGATVDLGGIGGLGRWVRLLSGRLPRPCTPTRCEVLQVGGQGALPRDPRLHLVRVGSGRLLSDLPLGGQLGLSQGPSVVNAQRYHVPDEPLILLAEGAGALSRQPELQDTYRTYSWVVPLERQDVHPWAVDALQARIQRASSALGAVSEFFSVTAPLDELQAARDATRVTSRRLLLVGGEAAALLLAFVFLAASSGSRDAEAASRRLTWLGANRRQLALVFLGEAVAIALAGTLLGWVAGAATGAVLATAASSPAGAVLSHSVASATGFLIALIVVAVTALLLLVSLWPRRPSRFGAVGLLDVAAGGALVAILLALARGGADSEALAQGRGTGVLLLLLPGLVAFVAAVVCMRALQPGLRLLERTSRRASLSLRLAGLSLARNPGRSAAAVAFLVVSLGLALFASTYRSTLVRNQADEAAFSVPLDFTLQENFAQGQYVLETAPPARYARLSPGARAYPVIRLAGDQQLGGSSGGTAILGVPAAALTHIRRWRSDFASAPPARLAADITPRGPVSLRGLRLPEDVSQVSLPVRLAGGALDLSANVQTDDGDFEQVELGAFGPGRHVLRAAVPADARGGLLVGLAADLPSIGHLGGDINLAFVPEKQSRGHLQLGEFVAHGPAGAQRLGSYNGWISRAGLKEDHAPGARAGFHYLVSGLGSASFRPRQPTDGKPVPVIASADLAQQAGPGGLLPVDLGGQQVLTKVVATARRFPTLSGSFVVGDERWLYTALNGPEPRAGLVTEMWVDGGSSPGTLAAALSRTPFDRLQVSSRRDVQAGLAADPLARGFLITLGAAALMALVLALAGLLLAVVSDLRDERGELDELEAQGASPDELRRHLRLRALIVSLAGALGALATGAILATLVVSVVRVTAGAASPEPPLRLDVGFGLVGLALAFFALAAGALVWLVTWSAFRRGRSVGAPAAEAVR